MDLRLLLIGAVLGVLFVSTSHAQLVEGSGAVDTTVATANVDDDSESDDDIYMSGSGEEPESTTASSNVRCVMAECWCIYSDGTEVLGTKVYGKRPDCSQYSNSPTSMPTLPTRPRSRVTVQPETGRSSVELLTGVERDVNIKCGNGALGLVCHCIYDDGTVVEGSQMAMSMALGTELKNIPDCRMYKGLVVPSIGDVSTMAHVANEVTEKVEDLDIEFIDQSKPGVADDNEETTLNNRVTVARTPSSISKEDEKEEEHSNALSNTGYLRSRDDDINKEVIESDVPHPGILAALIGGGVVGLLCAILLIVFIIYRVRKKDEGSYPLDDGKPLKNYAYSKAPSKEFYA